MQNGSTRPPVDGSKETEQVKQNSAGDWNGRLFYVEKSLMGYVDRMPKKKRRIFP
jgi:hypothetical protein